MTRKEYRRWWQSTPKGKAWRKAYVKRPHVRARLLKYHREYKRIHGRRYKWGVVGVEHFNKQLKKQNKRCSICGIRLINPQQDHNHKTKQLRGVLCRPCNTLLASVESGWFKKAIRYLQRWKHGR